MPQAKTNNTKKAKNAARMRHLYATSQEQRDYQKNLKLVKAYGITLNQYKEWAAAFDNVCHLCGQDCPSKRQLAVDHSHKSGLVRGLLCINCNKGLGNFKDNKQLLKKAIKYLELADETEEYIKSCL